MKYQLLHEDDKSFHVQHPDGSKFQVAKKGLNKDLVDKIKAMAPVKMAEGGQVPDPLDPSAARQPASDPRVSYWDTFKQLGGDLAYGAGKVAEPIVAPLTTGAGAEGQQKYDAGLRQMLGRSPQAPAPASVDAAPIQPDQPPQPDAPLPPPTPAAVPEAQGVPNIPGLNPQSTTMKYLGAVQGDYSKLGAAEKQNFQNQSNLYGQHVKDLQTREVSYDQEMEAQRKDLDSLHTSILSDKVDPNRVWSNLGAGNKMSAIAGLILGGMGAGLTKGPNQALEVLQKTIDRDIDAQKAEIGKKQNLYSYNLQKYHDTQTAEAATRLQMNTVFSAQLQKAAADSGSAEAQIRAKLAGDQLAMQVAPSLMNTVAMRQATSQTFSGIPAQGQMDQQMLTLDPEWAKHRVEVNGTAMRARTPQAADELNKTIPVYNDIKSKLNRLKELNDMGTRLSPELRQEASGLTHQLGMQINEFNGYKRFTDVDDKIIAKQFDDPLAFKTIFTNNAATNALLKSMTTKMDGDLSQQLPGYKGRSAVAFTPSAHGQTLPLNKQR